MAREVGRSGRDRSTRRGARGCGARRDLSQPFLLLSEIYETQGDATAAAAVLTPFFDVLAELDEEVAARAIMQAVSGGLSEIAFPYLAELEEQRPESLVLQRAVMHYLRHQRDWDSLRERLAWVAEHHDDVATDLELCARAEQGMIPAHDVAVSAALERLAARGGSIAELAVLGVTPVVIPALPGERVEVVATERGPVQVLSAAPVALDDEVGTLAPAGTAEPDEAALENELPTVPAQSAKPGCCRRSRVRTRRSISIGEVSRPSSRSLRSQVRSMSCSRRHRKPSWRDRLSWR